MERERERDDASKRKKTSGRTTTDDDRQLTRRKLSKKNSNSKQATTMARARHLSILAHSLLWPTILLALAGWIVSLAGISASQKTCNNTPGILNEVPQFAQTSDLPQIGCKRFLRFPWWIMWGSLVPIVGVAIAAASNRA
jgi:hypothetical protein